MDFAQALGAVSYMGFCFVVTFWTNCMFAMWNYWVTPSASSAPKSDVSGASVAAVSTAPVAFQAMDVHSEGTSAAGSENESEWIIIDENTHLAMQAIAKKMFFVWIETRDFPRH